MVHRGGCRAAVVNSARHVSVGEMIVTTRDRQEAFTIDAEGVRYAKRRRPGKAERGAAASRPTRFDTDWTGCRGLVDATWSIRGGCFAARPSWCKKCRRVVCQLKRRMGDMRSRSLDNRLYRRFGRPVQLARSKMVEEAGKDGRSTKRPAHAHKAGFYPPTDHRLLPPRP